MGKRTGWLALLLAACAMTASAQVDVAPYVRKDSFQAMEISPDGRYLAATVPKEDRTGVVILQRSDLKVTASFALGKNSHVDRIWWVNPERLVISISEKFGMLAKPQPTGELYAINADGRQGEILVGQRVVGAGSRTLIDSKPKEQIAAFMVDDLRGDDRGVIISAWPFSDDPYTRAERLDVYTGRRVVVARAPVQNAEFVTDGTGEVRFAYGAGSDNANKLYYRDGRGEEWRLVNDERLNHRREWPLGFSADGKLAYLQSEQAQGPDQILVFDPASGKRTPLLRDEVVDPSSVLYAVDGSTPIGVMYRGARSRAAFFDEESADARLYRKLEAAFPGEEVFITSRTDDGALALVEVTSDRNPGDFYVFDTGAGQAARLLSRGEWFDRAGMAPTKAIALAARDGTALHGYLTTPSGTGQTALPMVVLPHGGPFGIFDTNGFNTEVQLLARAGYAVLRLNYRGSGNYGRAFQQAGALEWGKKMQDDLTDATRWAIAQGVADPDRICIYGASYGAYAAMMGVVREPTLYRCAAGYVGVYDLPMMTSVDRRKSRSLATFNDEWVGTDPNVLAATSPSRLADRVKVPVFLAAGGEDEVAPIEQSRKLEAALKHANVPVESLYYSTEGHGFYVQAHRNEFYRRLLAFLDRNIGQPRAAAQSAVN
ncbi:MAG: prolyl oligopeptidase family serine peptidase [Luteimonas sp.]|nr:prolyl oligopeptidase family serine peptidase [Luteimonas sp.]